MIYSWYNRSKTRLVVESDGCYGVYGGPQRGLPVFKVSFSLSLARGACKAVDKETGEEYLDFEKLIQLIKHKDPRIRILKPLDYVK